MSLHDVRTSLTKARRFYAAGMHKHAVRHLVRAEQAYEKVTVALQEKLRQARAATTDDDATVMAKAAYDYSALVERAIELGEEIKEFREVLLK